MTQEDEELDELEDTIEEILSEEMPVMGECPMCGERIEYDLYPYSAVERIAELFRKCMELDRKTHHKSPPVLED